MKVKSHYILVLFIFASVFQVTKNAHSLDWNKICDVHESRANKGEILSQKLLAECYLLGHGRKKDIEKATYWYKKALKAGDSSVKQNMASIYVFEQNDKNICLEGIAILNSLAKERKPRSYLALAVAYQSSFCVKKDNHKTLELVTKAAEIGSTGAMASLYFIYRDGMFGVSPNNELSLYWKERLESFLSEHTILKENVDSYLSRFDVNSVFRLERKQPVKSKE